VILIRINSATFNSKLFFFVLQTYSIMAKFVYTFSLLLFLTSFKVADQTPLDVQWETLVNVDFKKKWNEEFKMNMEIPIFNNEIKKLAGRSISIAGFLIPVTTYGNEYVLSQNPYAGCYFCGNAGIESVMDLKFKNNAIRYKLDKYVVLQGTLQLNDKDATQFIYTLNNAVEVK